MVLPPVAVLCGGEGSRFAADVAGAAGGLDFGLPRLLIATLHGKPKFLAPIHEIPMLVHKMHCLISFGIGQFILLTNEQWQPAIEEALAKVALPKCTWRFSVHKPGILQQLQSIMAHTHDELLISASDTLAKIDYREFIAFHRQEERLASRALLKSDGRSFTGDALISYRLFDTLARSPSAGPKSFLTYLDALDQHGTPWPNVGKIFNVNDLRSYRELIECAAAGELKFLPSLQQSMRLETLPVASERPAASIALPRELGR